MLERELELAVEAAHRAGDAICAVYERDDFEVRQKSGDRGPLTEADLNANRVILEAIAGAFPGDGVLSEEATDDRTRLDKERVWIVDPLDGTREFTLRIPEFAVSIGLAVRGEIALGVLFNPATRELFTGVVGQGATYNGAACHVSTHREVRDSRLLVSRSEHKKGWFDAWKTEANLQPMGSVAYKFGLVAAGRAEATFTPRPRNEWDLAGGVACVIAAGGRATDGSGAPYRFNRPDPLVQGVCGTNGVMHAAVLEMMKGEMTRARTPGLGPVLMTVLLDLLGFGLVIPLLPYYAEQYGATGQQAMALMGMYSVAQFLFAPVWGALSDRIGRRPVMLVSIAGTALMLAAFASTTSLWLLFVWRFLHGACAANISTAQAYVADVTTREDRARGMGLIGAAFGVGFTLGPWVGGELARFGLSAPIWLAAGLSAVNLLWAALRLPESRTASAAPTASRTFDPRQLARGIAHPVVGLVLLLTFSATFAFSMMEYTFGLVAEHVWYPELDARQVAARVGRVFGLIGVIGIVIQGGLIGRLVKRFGEPTLITTGYLATGVGLVALAFTAGGAGSLLACAAIGVGVSLANPSLQALISRGVGDAEQGWVLGVNQSLSALARATAPWLAVGLYGLGATVAGAPTDAHGVFRGGAFVVAGLLMIVALGLSVPAARRARSGAPAS